VHLRTSDTDFNAMSTIFPTIEEVVQKGVTRGLNKYRKCIRDDSEREGEMGRMIVRVQS
jgi:hypothetical protein